MKRNSVFCNGKLKDYLDKLHYSFKLGGSFELHGHLKVYENNSLVFDQHNLIVDEGKGLVMDWLASLGFVPTYTVSPFSSIILTKNTATEQAGDTFVNSVYGPTDYLSDEGVLHIPTWTTVDHIEGSLEIELSGTLTGPYGNGPSNNHINSVCVVAGADLTTGGPGEAVYASSGNERLFSRVHVGDLVKTSLKTYNFSWVFTIQ